MENMFIPVKKLDNELQIVWGEVYVPDIPDSQGDFMSVTEVRKMAYGFMSAGLIHKVDRQHNNEETGSMVIESFIARKNDEDFIPNSWVVGIHIPDPSLWAEFKDGTLNGFSMEALVHIEKKMIEIEVPSVLSGITSEAEDHDHNYTIRFNDKGDFLGGETDSEAGHYHKIMTATVTEGIDSAPNGHKHRYSFIEAIVNAQN